MIIYHNMYIAKQQFFLASENSSKQIDKPYESAVDRLYKKLMGKVPQSGKLLYTQLY